MKIKKVIEIFARRDVSASRLSFYEGERGVEVNFTNRIVKTPIKEIRHVMLDLMSRDLLGLEADEINFVDTHPTEEELTLAVSRVVRCQGTVLAYGQKIYPL